MARHTSLYNLGDKNLRGGEPVNFPNASNPLCKQNKKLWNFKSQRNSNERTVELSLDFTYSWVFLFRLLNFASQFLTRIHNALKQGIN